MQYNSPLDKLIIPKKLKFQIIKNDSQKDDNDNSHLLFKQLLFDKNQKVYKTLSILFWTKFAIKTALIISIYTLIILGIIFDRYFVAHNFIIFLVLSLAIFIIDLFFSFGNVSFWKLWRLRIIYLKARKNFNKLTRDEIAFLKLNSIESEGSDALDIEKNTKKINLKINTIFYYINLLISALMVITFLWFSIYTLSLFAP